MVAPPVIDGAVPDAAGCSPACDNGLTCDGVEMCVGGMCVVDTAPDCGMDDVCATRGCAEPTGCFVQDNVLSVSFSVFLPAVTRTGMEELRCNGQVEVFSDTTACGGQTTLSYQCVLDGAGALRALSVTSDATACLGAAGPLVTTGCSVAPSTNLVSKMECCFN